MAPGSAGVWLEVGEVLRMDGALGEVALHYPCIARMQVGTRSTASAVRIAHSHPLLAGVEPGPPL